MRLRVYENGASPQSDISERTNEICKRDRDLVAALLSEHFVCEREGDWHYYHCKNVNMKKENIFLLSIHTRSTNKKG